MEKKTAKQILADYHTGVYINIPVIVEAMQTYSNQESEPLKNKIKELEVLLKEESDKVEIFRNRSIYSNQQIESLQRQLEEKEDAYSEIGSNYARLLDNFNQCKSDLTRMREENESLKNLLTTYVELDPEIHNNSLTIKILNNQAKSLLSNKEETNQDPKIERKTAVDNIYSCLSDILRTTSMPYNDSNEIMNELLKIKDSLVKIKSL